MLSFVKSRSGVMANSETRSMARPRERAQRLLPRHAAEDPVAPPARLVMGTPVKLPLVPGLVAQSPPVRPGGDPRLLCWLVPHKTGVLRAPQVAGPRAQTLSFKNGYALTESPLSVTGALVAAPAAPSDVAQTRVDQAPALSKPPGWLVNDKKVRHTVAAGAASCWPGIGWG